jgi:UDP-glucose 4-epimerase
VPSWGKSFVVTGGAGFVGSHIVDRLLALGAGRVTVIDNLSTGFRELVPDDPRVRFIHGDLLDAPLVARTMERHDFVFHIAANADIKDNLKDPRKCVAQNIVATQNVLEGMRAHGVKAIAFASTGSVYGEHDVIPTPEDAPMPVQTSIYATSKVAAEGLLTSYAWGFGFKTWIFRFVSLLGPRYSHGHVIDFYRRLKADPTRLPILGDGNQQKSYLHVLDCVEGMLTAIAKHAPKSPEEPHIGIYNLGHQEWIKVKDSVALICREMKVAPRLEYAGGVRGWIGDSPKILLATDKLRGLGWKPTRTIEESIVETLRAFEKHPFLLARA